MSALGLALNLVELVLTLDGYSTSYVFDPNTLGLTAKLTHFGIQSVFSLGFLGVAANVEFLSRTLTTLQAIRNDQRFN